MSAFCFFNITEFKDNDLMEQYRQKVIPTVEKFGGRYRVIGGELRIKEGDWAPTFPVLIEFPDLEAAESWYASEDYQEILPLRLSATEGQVVFLASAGL